MPQTLSQNSPDTYLVTKINDLQHQIDELRSNQVRKISFGNITIDGTLDSGGIITIGQFITMLADASDLGRILISDGSNNRIVIGNV